MIDLVNSSCRFFHRARRDRSAHLRCKVPDTLSKSIFTEVEEFPLCLSRTLKGYTRDVSDPITDTKVIDVSRKMVGLLLLLMSGLGQQS